MWRIIFPWYSGQKIWICLRRTRPGKFFFSLPIGRIAAYLFFFNLSRLINFFSFSVTFGLFFPSITSFRASPSDTRVPKDLRCQIWIWSYKKSDMKRDADTNNSRDSPSPPLHYIISRNYLLNTDWSCQNNHPTYYMSDFLAYFYNYLYQELRNYPHLPRLFGIPPFIRHN